MMMGFRSFLSIKTWSETLHRFCYYINRIAPYMDDIFKFSIDLNVLNHLGLGLYSSTPAVLTEIIANAYDADASEVRINLNIEDGIITIIDDGHGMTADD